jgi:hypothetical protein
MQYNRKHPGDFDAARKADERAREYFAKVEAEFKQRREELFKKYGLRPENPNVDPHDMELDPNVAQAIDDFFARFERVYMDGGDWNNDTTPSAQTIGDERLENEARTRPAKRPWWKFW